MALFKPAVREKLKARVILMGPAGSGKTYGGLRCATTLGGRLAVIDTEHGAARKYIGEKPDGKPWQFDVLELTTFSLDQYEGGIREAANAGYDSLLIDSLSHAWQGEGGILDIVDKITSKSGSKDAFTSGWKTASPMQRRLVETMLAADIHLVATARTKVEYVIEKNQQGKNAPRKIGITAVQREGMEYEFDIVGEIDDAHILTVTKSRCPALQDQNIVKPGAAFWKQYRDWLDTGDTPVNPRQKLLDDYKLALAGCVDPAALPGLWTASGLGAVKDDEYYTAGVAASKARKEALATAPTPAA